MRELARLAIKAKSEAVRVAAIRELLDRGYGKAQQMVENEVGPSDLTAEELRTELLADFAALFPDFRIVPATPRRRLNNVRLSAPTARCVAFSRDPSALQDSA
jgi:hypothetical protein